MQCDITALASLRKDLLVCLGDQTALGTKGENGVAQFTLR